MSSMRRTTLAILFTAAALTACSDDGTGDTPDAAPCVPRSCQSEGKDCGKMPDGCGQTIQCGTCQPGETCGAGGVANVCGAGSCTPTTCAARGKNCGVISDGCSDVLSCGTCSAPQTCGGAGTANVCGVKPDAGGPKPDGGASGACDPTCMAQSGAVCCTACGCTGAVKCKPVCDSPAKWDCEMGCCFDYTAKKCI
jgi:hypothetical protein